MTEVEKKLQTRRLRRAAERRYRNATKTNKNKPSGSNGTIIKWSPTSLLNAAQERLRVDAARCPKVGRGHYHTKAVRSRQPSEPTRDAKSRMESQWRDSTALSWQSLEPNAPGAHPGSGRVRLLSLGRSGLDHLCGLPARGLWDRFVVRMRTWLMGDLIGRPSRRRLGNVAPPLPPSVHSAGVTRWTTLLQD